MITDRIQMNPTISSYDLERMALFVFEDLQHNPELDIPEHDELVESLYNKVERLQRP